MPSTTPLSRGAMLAAVGLFSAAQLSAVTIIQWGNNANTTDIVTAQTTLTVGTTLVAANSNNPAYGTNGYYQSTTYANFSAALNAGYTPVFSAAASSGTTAAIGNNITGPQFTTGGTDALQFSSNTPLGLYLWQQTQFTPSASVAESITLNSITYKVGINATTSTTSNNYIVVKLNGAYYISAGISSLNNSGNTPLVSRTASQLASLSWSTYNPITDLTVPGSFNTTLTLSDFSDVEAVGVVLTASASASRTVALSYINVDGTINASSVPEPSTFALLAGLGALGFAARRRRSA